MNLQTPKVGKRLVVEKSEYASEQFVPTGERGTIVEIYKEGSQVILTIAFDNGCRYNMDTNDFEFQVY